MQRLARGELAPPDDLEQVLALSVGYLSADETRMPTQIEEGGGLVAGPAPGIWVLAFADAPGPLSGRLTQACANGFITGYGRTGELTPGTPAMAQQADQAVTVLTTLLPKLGAGLLRHLSAVGMVTAEDTGTMLLSAAGGIELPGTIVVRPDQLASPWDAAGRLLHEALHLKLFDICACVPLYASLNARVDVPWRAGKWEMRRVLAAFHVYAHMTLYHAAVAARSPAMSVQFGSPPANPGVSTARSHGYAEPQQRLRYLGEQLLGPLASDLTPAGRRFIAWQLAAIAPLTGWQPPPPAPPAPPAPSPDQAAARREQPATGYRRTPGLALSPVPDARILLIFNPATNVLHTLNLAAWAAFEVCDGRDLAAMRTAHADLVSAKLTAAQAAVQLDAALAQLRQAALIEPATGERR